MKLFSKIHDSKCCLNRVIKSYKISFDSITTNNYQTAIICNTAWNCLTLNVITENNSTRRSKERKSKIPFPFLFLSIKNAPICLHQRRKSWTERDNCPFEINGGWSGDTPCKENTKGLFLPRCLPPYREYIAVGTWIYLVE